MPRRSAVECVVTIAGTPGPTATPTKTASPGSAATGTTSSNFMAVADPTFVFAAVGGSCAVIRFGVQEPCSPAPECLYTLAASIYIMLRLGLLMQAIS